ncbi:hypothetical protein EDB80DRAFT_718476 [Ilyonectria destructans]|nr:hypothetical protein EDB80DRAFT_718476 [Ilyonectria destructans]
MAVHQPQSSANTSSGHITVNSQKVGKGSKNFKSDVTQRDTWTENQGLCLDNTEESWPSVSNGSMGPTTSIPDEPEEPEESEESETTAGLPPDIPSPTLDDLIDEVISEWSEDSKSEQNCPPNEQMATLVSLQQLQQGHPLNEKGRWEAFKRNAFFWRDSRRRSPVKGYNEKGHAQGKKHDDDFFALADWLGRARTFAGTDSPEVNQTNGPWMLLALRLLVLLLISLIFFFLRAQFVWPISMAWVATSFVTALSILCVFLIIFSLFVIVLITFLPGSRYHVEGDMYSPDQAFSFTQHL